MPKISRFPTIPDLSVAARRRIPKFVYDYLEGGTGRDETLARNRRSLDAVQLTPKYFIDVTSCDTSATIFGQQYALPVGIAPVGYGNLIWPNADKILAVAAAAANVPYVLSTAATTSIEDIAEVAGRPPWFQLYPSKETSITDDLIRRASQVGCQVLVITIDAPVPATRERLVRSGHSVRMRIRPSVILDCLPYPAWCMQMLRFGLPELPNILPYLENFPEMQNDARQFGSLMAMRGVTRDEILRIRDLWQGKLIIKGILSGEMAMEAMSLGADGLVVSNHGGRQFDASPASIDALPEVVAAVGGNIPVLFDGGIRGGLDVLKAKALGACLILSGRPFYYGVAAFSEKGARRVIDIFRDEITRGLKQLGCTRFCDFDGRWLSSTSTHYGQ